MNRSQYINSKKKRVDINIPIRIIEKYNTSKAQKDALAFAICIKSTYENSELRDVTVKRVMQLCRISFKRAKSLISLAQNDDYLFTCIGDKIMVNSFKDKTVKYNRKGQAYHSDYCYKYPVAKNQFRTILKEIRIILIENAINAGERRPLSTKGDNCGVEITQKQMANIVGISRGYVSRITSEMSAERGTIKKNKAKIILAMNTVNEYTIAEFRKKTGKRNFIINPHTGCAYFIKPCTYSIKDRTETSRFKHVIFDQWIRVNSVVVNSNNLGNDIMDSELMGAYN